MATGRYRAEQFVGWVHDGCITAATGYCVTLGVVSLSTCANWRLRSATRSLRVAMAPDGLPSGDGPLRVRRLSPALRVFSLLGERMRHRAMSTPWPLESTSNCSTVT